MNTSIDLPPFEGDFTLQDILLWMEQAYPLLTPSNRKWKIHQWVQQGHIQRVGRGRYARGAQRNYIPYLAEQAKEVAKALMEQYPYLHYCVWNTKSFSGWMQHQPGQFFNILETEREGMEAVFYWMKEQGIKALLSPSSKEIELYAEEWVILPLVSEAPTQLVSGIHTCTLEKMLVDIFCGHPIFAAQQGSEMRHIFKGAQQNYSLNKNTMLRYASRRKRRYSLEKYLQNGI